MAIPYRNRILWSTSRSRSRGIRRLPVTLRLAGGWLCVALGLIGVVLPLVPGLPFLLVGGKLLGWEPVLLRQVERWYRARGGRLPRWMAFWVRLLPASSPLRAGRAG